MYLESVTVERKKREIGEKEVTTMTVVTSRKTIKDEDTPTYT